MLAELGGLKELDGNGDSTNFLFLLALLELNGQSMLLTISVSRERNGGTAESRLSDQSIVNDAIKSEQK